MLTFACIGAQKCGTSWLQAQLKSHPELEAGRGKEVHFWDRSFHRGVEWYKGIFTSQKKQGDFTPAYAALTEDKIRLCHQHFPDLRLIYLVRDPVERGWSSLCLMLNALEIKPAEISDRFILDYFNAQATHRRAAYRQCIENWCSLYPAEQLLVLHFDDLKHKPRRLLARTMQHIGVTPGHFPPDAQLRRKVNSSARNRPVPDSVRRFLEEKYLAEWEAVQPLITRV